MRGMQRSALAWMSGPTKVEAPRKAVTDAPLWLWAVAADWSVKTVES